MRIHKWKVALPIFVCATLCLYAAKNPENTDTNVSPSVLNTDDNVPPGVVKADWHAITDDFGFTLQITKEPIIHIEYNYNLESILDRFTDESKREIMENIKEQNERNKARNETLRPYDVVGRAQGLFFAREANKWYMVTTPPPPVGLHLLQSVEP